MQNLQRDETIIQKLADALAALKRVIEIFDEMEARAKESAVRRAAMENSQDHFH